MEIEVRTTAIISILTAISLLSGLAYSALQISMATPSHGTVKTINLKAFQDPECTIPLNVIEWGMLEPGDSYTFECYLLNDGSAPSTLTMHTENWNPTEASNYLTLTWDAENKTLQPKSPLMATFSLNVNPDIQGIEEFSFDIIITATS